jgi:hypothetical protein
LKDRRYALFADRWYKTLNHRVFNDFSFGRFHISWLYK